MIKMDSRQLFLLHCHHQHGHQHDDDEKQTKRKQESMWTQCPPYPSRKNNKERRRWAPAIFIDITFSTWWISWLWVYYRNFLSWFCGWLHWWRWPLIYDDKYDDDVETHPHGKKKHQQSKLLVAMLQCECDWLQKRILSPWWFLLKNQQ